MNPPTVDRFRSKVERKSPHTRPRHTQLGALTEGWWFGAQTTLRTHHDTQLLVGSRLRWLGTQTGLRQSLRAERLVYHADGKGEGEELLERRPLWVGVVLRAELGAEQVEDGARGAHLRLHVVAEEEVGEGHHGARVANLLPR